jgi:hypothetical protein
MREEDSDVWGFQVRIPNKRAALSTFTLVPCRLSRPTLTEYPFQM